MAITVDWGQKIIQVPRADMVLLQTMPTEIRELDLNAFRLELKSLEDNVQGITYLDTHQHNTTVEVGGVILARVIEIINGYTVTFEDGQYAVNLKGANSNVADVVNVNQVSVRSANSAGLQDLSTLLQAAYGGLVHVDVINGQVGTSIPLGTRGRPVNNFADALLIAEANSLRGIQVMESATLSAGNFASGFIFYGDSPTVTTLTLEAGVDVQDCGFQNMTIEGVMDGDNTFRECIINNISYTNGTIVECALQGTITLGGNAQCSILDCWSNVAGAGAGQFAEVDMGGAGNSLVVRNYSGGLGLKNYSGGGDVSMDFSSGRIVVESTVTAGSLTVRGIADVVDNSTGTAVITDATVNEGLDQVIIGQGVISTAVDFVRKLLGNRAVVANDDSITTIYDDDKVTPILVHDHPSARERNPQ